MWHEKIHIVPSTQINGDSFNKALAPQSCALSFLIERVAEWRRTLSPHLLKNSQKLFENEIIKSINHSGWKAEEAWKDMTSLHHYHSKFSQISVFLFVSQDRVVLCRPGCPGTLSFSLCRPGRPQTHKDPSRSKGMCHTTTTMLNLSNFNGSPKKLKNILECSDSLPLNSVILKVLWKVWSALS